MNCDYQHQRNISRKVVTSNIVSFICTLNSWSNSTESMMIKAQLWDIWNICVRKTRWEEWEINEWKYRRGRNRALKTELRGCLQTKAFCFILYTKQSLMRIMSNPMWKAKEDLWVLTRQLEKYFSQWTNISMWSWLTFVLVTSGTTIYVRLLFYVGFFCYVGYHGILPAQPG